MIVPLRASGVGRAESAVEFLSQERSADLQGQPAVTGIVSAGARLADERNFRLPWYALFCLLQYESYEA